MHFRQAHIDDIKQMQFVRNSVKENMLSDPNLVKDKDYEIYLNGRGKGWVCEVQKTVVGFAIIDLEKNNVWALFVLPEFEKQGIGKQLHRLMLHWYFLQTKETIWLSTAPGTRAEKFYRKQGWFESGLYGKAEIKFEMSFSTFSKMSNNSSVSSPLF